MNILIIVNSLAGGGAEKTIQTLVNHWVQSDEVEKITILCIDKLEPQYEIAPEVEIVNVPAAAFNRGPGRILSMPFQAFWLARFIRKRKPDHSISYLVRSNLVHILSRWFGNSTPIIICEQTSSFDFYADQRSWLTRQMSFVIRYLYPKADLVLAASTAVGERLIDAGVSRQKVKMVFNPVPTLHFAKLRNEFNDSRKASQKRIITIGRLSPEKDHQTLLRAFAKVRKAIPEASLTIVGKGPEEANLNRLIAELDLSSSVGLPGWHPNPGELLVASDLFVLTSTSEGFGVVLVEAMACGLPIISTQCPGGPSEILENGASGVLVPVGAVDELANAMEALLSSPARISELKEKGLARAQRFSTSRIAQEYLETLSQFQPSSAKLFRRTKS